MSAGIKRLQKEYDHILRNPNVNFISQPDPDNIFDWYYCIFGLEGQYKGGVYFGMLKFPNEYPFKPPSIIMITPSGRFESGQRICLTMSDWHPEQWNPIWKVESIIIGLMSFMQTEEHSVASLHQSVKVREELATKSIEWNNQNFRIG